MNLDYHVRVRADEHHYSVPYRLAGEKLDVRLTAEAIECFHKGERVASHPRSQEKNRHSTLPDHMPTSHREHAKWTPERLVHWAGKTGGETAALIETILASRPHPQQGFRACLGIMRLGKLYGQDRLEAACARALALKATSFKSVESILKKGLDKQPLPGPEPEPHAIDHDNIRGPEYYS